MEIAELVLKYIEALVWPLVTLTLVWGLRSHIGRAFGRMTRLETPAGAIEFETDAREVRDEAEELATATERSQREPQPGVEEPSTREEVVTGEEMRRTPSWPSGYEDFREARRMIEASPVGAVVTASNALERIAADALRRHPDAEGYRPLSSRSGRLPTMGDLVRGLAHVGLSDSAVRLFERLNMLRNEAVHGRTVTPSAAFDFVDSCLLLARQLDEFSR
ncbi:hypothetical protein ACFW6X_16195 [Streptomyces bacillaris]|uniref:hypothetical protein n=1 Tax=Streptomyces bacillaris TaxID=68179 RepID=UPI00369C3E8E